MMAAISCMNKLAIILLQWLTLVRHHQCFIPIWQNGPANTHNNNQIPIQNWCGLMCHYTWKNWLNQINLVFIIQVQRQSSLWNLTHMEEYQWCQCCYCSCSCYCYCPICGRHWALMLIVSMTQCVRREYRWWLFVIDTCQPTDRNTNSKCNKRNRSDMSTKLVK